MPNGESWMTKLLHAVIGRRLRSSEGKGEQITALEGIPYLGLDALASICYGSEAALAVLTLAGVEGLSHLLPVVLVPLVVLAMLQFSYRQTIRAPILPEAAPTRWPRRTWATLGDLLPPRLFSLIIRLRDHAGFDPEITRQVKVAEILDRILMKEAP